MCNCYVVHQATANRLLTPNSNIPMYSSEHRQLQSNLPSLQSHSPVITLQGGLLFPDSSYLFIPPIVRPNRCAFRFSPQCELRVLQSTASSKATSPRQSHAGVTAAPSSSPRTDTPQNHTRPFSAAAAAVWWTLHCRSCCCRQRRLLLLLQQFLLLVAGAGQRACCCCTL